ncbi:MFS transporter [Paenibacillus flagellatus]|uniref:MFS transporter n=1 Tax=Paenibacillus flagellatus TaxID=2211139 RepID=A0A2V5K9E7_9BACL|nr:MFS transporter [Paenibacillus flagellatus]PYI55472.1 MFS transporter [Paenibacillus flagellatus]
MNVLRGFTFAVYGAMAVLFTFLPLHFKEIGLSKIEIGLVMAGGPLISVIGNPFWGYWSDRLQHIRLVLLLMLAGNFAAALLVFRADGMLGVAFAMLLFFFFQSSLFSQSNSLILNAIEGTAHRFGSFRSWGSLGWAVMAAAAGPVLASLGIGKLGIVYGVMLLAAIAVALWLPRGGAKGAKGGFSFRDYGRLFGDRTLLAFLGLGVLISVPNSVNSTFVSLYMAELGGSETLIGWSVFLSTALEVPAFLLYDKWFGRKTSALVGTLSVVSVLFAVRWLLMATAGGAATVIWIQMTHCLTFGAYYYIGTQLTARLVPPQYRASGQAAYALTWNGLSGIVAGLIGGWMFQSLGPGTAYTVGAAVSAAGAVGFWLLWRTMKRAESPSRDGSMAANP